MHHEYQVPGSALCFAECGSPVSHTSSISRDLIEVFPFSRLELKPSTSVQTRAKGNNKSIHLNEHQIGFEPKDNNSYHQEEFDSDIPN